jgi:hypothetical protein
MATLQNNDSLQMGLLVTLLINDAQHDSNKYYYAECRFFIVMLSFTMMNVVMLSVLASIEVADSDKQASLLRIRS